MSVIIIIFIIIMVIYYIKDNKRINSLIKDSISQKYNFSKENAKTSRNKKSI